MPALRLPNTNIYQHACRLKEMKTKATDFVVSGQPMASDLKFQGMRASISDAGQP